MTRIRNVLQKWYENQGSIVFYTHFPKDQNCEVCLQTETTKAYCRKRTDEVLILNEEGESRIITGTLSMVQDLGHHRIESYPCKTKTSQETEKSLRKFLEPSKKTTIHWHLENLVKIYDGIIEFQRLIDPRRTALLKELYDE